MLFQNATLADDRTRDVRIEDERIAEIDTDLSPEADERVVDATDKLLLPGAIDAHVHFRQPGYEHKETWASGSKSAAAGGVTTVVDQPNTSPPTVSGEAFDEKADYARESLVDWGINGGVTAEWDPDSLFSKPVFALGEVFLADSTGNMGIEADLFADAVARAAEEDVVVTVHAEDATLFDDSAKSRAGDDYDAWSAYRAPEAEAAAVERALEVGGDSAAQIHIAHTSTPEGADLAHDAGASCEVTPHHLFLSRDDYDELETKGRMNPPLRSEERRAGMLERLLDGTIDIVATDHAPHTVEEKDASIWDAPSGVPGVETMLPLLLETARAGTLSYERVRDVTAANVAEIFDLPQKGRVEVGNDADLVLVDPEASREIRGEDLHSNCGWTPFEGRRGVFPELTLVRGSVVYERSGEETEQAERTEQFGDAAGQNVRE
ncbi:dihydroorotase [Halogranum rubrum]|uniref:Dihydroorotase n=1 Tax=Halogranum salarium B-1 TaxID=1210908 RepID=J3EV30_9EURY|nr:dihydroorotase [Halogranum salarium]EJN58392.1 dihydroorotase, multifunctional complex type [Halogranum salarium B-1]